MARNSWKKPRPGSARGRRAAACPPYVAAGPSRRRPALRPSPQCEPLPRPSCSSVTPTTATANRWSPSDRCRANRSVPPNAPEPLAFPRTIHCPAFRPIPSPLLPGRLDLGIRLRVPGPRCLQPDPQPRQQRVQAADGAGRPELRIDPVPHRLHRSEHPRGRRRHHLLLQNSRQACREGCPDQVVAGQLRRRGRDGGHGGTPELNRIPATYHMTSRCSDSYYCRPTRLDAETPHLHPATTSGPQCPQHEI